MKRERPKTVEGYTIKRYVGCGTIYITINHDEHSPIEVFIVLGKAGGCIGSLLGIIGRMVSLALRNETDLEEVLSYIEEIKCPKSAEQIEGCPEAIAYAIKKYLIIQKSKEKESGQECLIFDHQSDR